MDIGTASHIFLEAFAAAPSDVRTLVLRRILRECTRTELAHIHRYTGKSSWIVDATTGEEKIVPSHQVYGSAFNPSAQTPPSTAAGTAGGGSLKPKSPIILRRALSSSKVIYNIHSPMGGTTSSTPNGKNNNTHAKPQHHSSRQHPNGSSSSSSNALIIRNRHRTYNPTTTANHQSILTLPDEIVLAIFTRVAEPKTLANVAQVCKKWGELLRDNILWKIMCQDLQFVPLTPSRASSSSTIPGASSRFGRRAFGRRRTGSARRHHHQGTGTSTPPGTRTKRNTSNRSSRSSSLNRERERTVSNTRKQQHQSHQQQHAMMLRHKLYHRAWMLAPWKAVYRQNHLTKMNWKKGK
jgi:hypothetical protein